jgi:thioredoxin reductase (NADPH)
MEEFDCDLAVIGGGSGGMSCAKKAAELGANVILFDYVKPSTQGNTWGLGGTCVNVGCVPKKLMHFAGLLRHGIQDAEAMGWGINDVQHDWSTLVESVTNHVQMLNFRYRTGLKNKNVRYINALAEFGANSNTVVYREKGKEGEPKSIRARYVVLAVGGRPLVPSTIPGAIEHAITSDDIFTLERPPGKTLCVGGSYIALECAGFLTELGYDVTVAVRTKVILRGFDVQCATKVGDLMDSVGTKMLYDTVVNKISRTPDGKFIVALEDTANGNEYTQKFDTVFFATGRYPDVKGLNLHNVGIETNAASGKVKIDSFEQTTAANVFAVGDICEGKLELTPVAIKCGELLAKRLFGGSSQCMRYDLVPTTVFTPFEYGSIGMTEEEAIKRYGEEDIEVYLSEFTTLELSAVHRHKHPRHGSDEDLGHNCLSKLVTVKSENERVVGFHFVGPNAGEITQGFALAVKMGATKADFDDLVGIHPTDAESFCQLSITKRSGVDFGAAGGCGGGVCG